MKYNYQTKKKKKINNFFHRIFLLLYRSFLLKRLYIGVRNGVD